MRPSLRLAAVCAAVLSITLGTGIVSAHEVREIDDITMVVGFLDEPVFVGQKSGLDLRVTHAEEPVEGLEETLEAEVIFGDETRALELSPAFGEPGRLPLGLHPDRGRPVHVPHLRRDRRRADRRVVHGRAGHVRRDPGHGREPVPGRASGGR